MDRLELPSIDQILSLVHAAEKWHLLDMEAVALNELVIDHARQNDKRPAYIKVFVPDSWALSLRGDNDLKDIFVALRIPREAVLSLKREQQNQKKQEVPAEEGSTLDLIRKGYFSDMAKEVPNGDS